MPMRALLLSLGFAVALAGCQRDAADTTTPTPAKSPVTASTSHDALSYAEPDKVAITDLALELKVDFGTKTNAGTTSEERRVGKGCVSTFRFRWSPDH